MFLYRKDITRHWRWTVFYLCIKLIAVPLTMIPILYILGIKGQAAQMAVVVSAFPIAISAFNLSKKYVPYYFLLITTYIILIYILQPGMSWAIIKQLDVSPSEQF